MTIFAFVFGIVVGFLAGAAYGSRNAAKVEAEREKVAALAREEAAKVAAKL